jgi:hypothetical protein
MKIASALTSELKDRNSRAKLVAGWTGANERTVKNWISGRYAPCGRHLGVLAQHSDQVLNAILLMADRQDRFLGGNIEDLRRKVFELAAIVGSPVPMIPIPDQGSPIRSKGLARVCGMPEVRRTRVGHPAGRVCWCHKSPEQGAAMAELHRAGRTKIWPG